MRKRRVAKKPAARKTKRGRPTKITPELTRKMCRLILGGSYVETAAAMCGITRETLYAWGARGQAEASGPYRDFSDSIDVALAETEIRDVRRIDSAAAKDWKAAAWRLGRRFPERWAERTIVRVEVEKQTHALLEQLKARLPPHIWRIVVGALSGVVEGIGEGGARELAAAGGAGAAIDTEAGSAQGDPAPGSPGDDRSAG